MSPKLTKWDIFKQVGYNPHPEQRKFHADKERFKLAVAGRRFGKSRMASAELFGALFSTNLPYWIVAPHYGTGEREFSYLWDDLIITLGLGDQIKHKAYNPRAGEMFIKMPWGSSVEVKSATNKDSLVGEGLGGVILAEAAKLPPDIWQKYIRPALADHLGWATFVTTPEGFNWFYRLYLDAQQDPDWKIYHFPSWLNPYVYPGGRDDPEITSTEKGSSRQWFQQEIGAEFTSFVGKIFDEFHPEIHIIDHQYDPALPNYGAIDWGYQNPFCFLDIQVSGSDTVYVWREYYKEQEIVSRHIEELKERVNPLNYKVEFASADSADPGGVEEFNQNFCPVYATNDAKDWQHSVHEIKKLLDRRQPKLFIDRSCENFIKEIQNYRAKPVKDPEKQNSYEVARKNEDHGVDALRYFVMHKFVLGAGYHLSDVMDAYSDPGSRPEVGSTAPSDERGIFTMGGREF